MMGLSDKERIAQLETTTKNHGDDVLKVIERLDSIDKKVQVIVTELSESKSFFRGVIFTLTTFSGVIGAAAAWAWNHLTGR